MIKGPITRKRQNQKEYLKYLQQHPKTKACVFCTIHSRPEEIVATFTFFYVAIAIAKYDMWDNLGVEEHLMIIPKRHLIGVDEFNPEESQQFFSIISEYEKEGFSLYQRAPTNMGKSVMHQHSHLLRLDNNPKKFVIYLNNPHINIHI